MKNISFLTFLSLVIGMLSPSIYAQVVTGSADGSSSIIYKGGALGYNINDKEISFDYIGTSKCGLKRTKSNWVLGVSAKGKNEDNSSILFDNGKLTPSSKLDGYFGFSWNRPFTKKIKANIKSQALTKGTIAKLVKELRDEIYLNTDKTLKTMQDEKKEKIKEEEGRLQNSNLPIEQLNQIMKNIINLSAELDTINSVYKYLSSVYYEEQNSKENNGVSFVASLNKLIEDIEKDSKRNLTEKLIAKNLKSLSEKIELQNFDKKIKINALGNTLDDLIKESYSLIKDEWNPFKITPYVSFGFSSLSFLQTEGINVKDFESSFKRKKSFGDKSTLGINFEKCNVVFGISYTRLNTNNFDSLSRVEYKHQETFKQDEETVTKTKDIVAYTGDYHDKFKINQLSMDLSCFAKINNEHYIIINTFLRTLKNSEDSDIIAERSAFGVGLYTFKIDGKFLGGLYFQINDANSSVNRDNISYGIVGKYTFDSIIKSR